MDTIPNGPSPSIPPGAVSMTTLAATLAQAYHLPALAHPLERLDEPVVCPFAGTPITEGVPVARLITDATADVPSTFHGVRHVSADGARCFAAPSMLKGNLAVVDGTGVRPFIARTRTTPERPAWTDLVRSLRPGAMVVLIVTDESQRRLWPQARLGIVSNAGYPVLLNRGLQTRLLTVRHDDLLACLDVVEALYACGWRKRAIEHGLLSYRHQDHVRTVGYAAARHAEMQIAAWRASDVFRLSVVIAQKPIEEDT